ncbi:protein FAM228A isoform X2 [Stegostoma tigrinum]|uniref:protein FAM228A isoform X2 n=1 Tax=Stegostoma tigrinum TaxID=3053191 RepID=UPI00202B40B5|nr:protein FAM228A isoform X2 [Stegostoma tigrinum]
MSSRRHRSDRISIHRPYPSDEISTTDTCPMKFLSAQRNARKGSPEKCQSVSVCSTDKTCVDWLSKKSFAYLQDKADKESLEVSALCQPLYDVEECFIKELDKYIAYKDMLNLRKNELLYKKWNDYIYERIQWKIKAKLNQSVEKRRPAVLQYLDYCNKKEPVFLEEYNPDDFNPFVRHLCKPHTFKTRTSTIHDPLLFQGRSKIEEDIAILQCQRGNLCQQEDSNNSRRKFVIRYFNQALAINVLDQLQTTQEHLSKTQKGKVYSLKEAEEFHKAQLPLVPLGRQYVDCNTWLRVPLGYIESEVRQRSRCFQSC